MLQIKLALVDISDYLKLFLICGLVLIPVLFLLENSIKYLLYIIGILISLIFLLTIFKIDFKFNFNSTPLVNIIDYFLISCAILVFISNTLGVLESTFNFVLTLFIAYFLPGWSLLRVLGINSKDEFNFGHLSISFAVSVGLTSIIFLFMFPIMEDKAIYLSSVYLGISFLPVIKNRLLNFNNQKKIWLKPVFQKKYSFLELLLIGGLIIFFAVAISLMYPMMAFVPSDMVRHYSAATELLVTPDIYASSYPWYHFLLSTVQALSDPPMMIFHTGVAILSIMLLFSFYKMSKLYLSEIHKHSHIFATIFFFVFSGLGWLFFISQKMVLPETTSYFDILLSTNNVSFWDVGYGQGPWLWLWFRPVTLGFTIFFVLLYLMKKPELSRNQYIIVTSLLLVTLIQVHVPEFLMFVLLILIISFVKPRIKLRIKETAISILISLFVLSLVSAYQNLFTSSFQALGQERLLIITGLSVIILLFTKFPQRPKISMKLNWKIATSITLFAYLTLLMFWFYNVDNFSLSNVIEILGVPWELYPMLLGIVGIIAIPGVFYTLKKYRNNSVVIFVILFATVFVAGRILTFVNAESIVNAGYWERRLIPYVYFSSSILAAIFVTKILQYWNISWKISYVKKISFFCIVAFLVFGGIFSTYLTLEFQFLKTENNSLTINEQSFLEILQDIDPYSIFLTISERSRAIADFQSTGVSPDKFRTQLWTSYSPEVSLNTFSTFNSPTIIFLSEIDNKYIKNYRDGYIASHLVKSASSTVHDNLTVIEIPEISPPVPTSEMFLILPDLEGLPYFAYDILSLGSYDYSTALFSDVSTWKNARILVIPSEDIILPIIEYKEKFGLSFEKIIVLNLDGFRTFPISLSKNSLPITDDFTSFRTESKGIGYRQIGDSMIIETPNIQIYGENVTANYGPDLPFVIHSLMAKPLSKLYTENGDTGIIEFDTFDLIYMNVFPITEKLDAGYINSTKLYPMLGNLLDFSKNDLPKYEHVKRSKYALFKDGEISFMSSLLQGDSKLNSTSVIIYLNSSSIQGKIDGIKFQYDNVSRILPIDVELVSVKTDEVKIKGGTGFYTKLIVNPSKVDFVGESVIILLENYNGNQTVLNGRNIQLDFEKSIMLMRQPKISSIGTSTFESLTTYGNIQHNLQIINKDTSWVGKSVFQTKFSDEYIVAQKSSFQGDIIQTTPRYHQDELGNLMKIFNSSFLPYFGLFTLVFVVSNFFILKKHNKNLNKNN